MARGGNLWLQQFVCKQDPEDDMRFSPVRASKSADEVGRLRKLTSLTYLSGKLRELLHREHRDTIVCEEDEESPASKRNIYDIIRRSQEPHTTGGFDLTKFDGARPAAYSHSVSLPTQPSKEQRWCTNCSKCFQRGLSKFDQYCGLDCKTAHRLRQPYQHVAQSSSLVSEETLAVRAAASRPPPHFTTHSIISQRRG